MQQEGIDLHNTLAPVVNWSTVRLLVIIADMAGWKSRQIDYVLDLSKSTISSEVYLHLLEVLHVYGEDKNVIYFLNLKNNIYETRQAAANWFDMIKLDLKIKVLNKTKQNHVFL